MQSVGAEMRGLPPLAESPPSTDAAGIPNPDGTGASTTSPSSTPDPTDVTPASEAPKTPTDPVTAAPLIVQQLAERHLLDDDAVALLAALLAERPDDAAIARFTAGAERLVAQDATESNADDERLRLRGLLSEYVRRLAAPLPPPVEETRPRPSRTSGKTRRARGTSGNRLAPRRPA
jgi:hypothetical protein